VDGVLELLARRKTAVEALDIVGRHFFLGIQTLRLNAETERAKVAQVHNLALQQFLMKNFFKEMRIS
jgi:hypothetical protein